MSLINRYKKLTIWNKIAFLGSVSSIIGLSLFFIPNYDKAKINKIEIHKTDTNIDKIELNMGAFINNGIQNNVKIGGTHNDK